jgi:putative membrane protein
MLFPGLKAGHYTTAHTATTPAKSHLCRMPPIRIIKKFSMLWLKAFHIVFVVAWFVGVFALPRLFVYHASITDPAAREQFKVMERRMFGMMTFGAVMALIFAVAMLIVAPGFSQMPWMHAKLALVALLLAYHGWCWRLVKDFAADRNVHSPTWYRWFNEAPLALLIGIVVLVVVKPF